MTKSIWGKLSKLLGDNQQQEQGPHKELHVVTAALMVRVSVTHDDFNVEEKQSILKSIQKHFDIDGDIADKILDKATKDHDNATDLYSFTRVIMGELEQEGQKEIVRLLYQVAFADNNLDHFEEQVISKISGLLGVGVRDRVKIKQEVRDEQGLT